MSLKPEFNNVCGLFKPLIFAPECWKCILRGPEFKVFPETCAFAVCFFPSLPTPKLDVKSCCLTNSMTSAWHGSQLLCPKTLVTFSLSGDFWSHARQGNRSSFTNVHFWTCKYMGRKTNVCKFCSLITQISFFVVSKVCLSKYMCIPFPEP